MKSGLYFLIAAKRCEIDDLQQLARTSELVNVTGRLIHGLQRERGLSNLLLASRGAHFSETRHRQITECQHIEAALRACLDALDTTAVPASGGARLFSRVAYVLQGLDALPALRESITALAWTAKHATEAYVRLIAGLLALVFEAADSACDPEVSRRLVALFNFMQGKEFSGQERALGAALLAAGRADGPEQQRLLHLIDAQERCLQVFQTFASDAVSLLWQQAQHSPTQADLERMRRILCTSAHGAALDATSSPVWFDICSRRIDGMKAVEDALAHELKQICGHKIAAAQAELASYETLNPSDAVPQSDLSFFEESAAASPGMAMPPHGFGHQLEHSILTLVQEQAARLQTVSHELDTVRASLNERKVIERAKGLLMAHRHLSEADAHKTMRQMAMNQNRRLIDVAEAVLAMAHVLGPVHPVFPSANGL